ncbi:hypothetical protein EG327_009308 [Venturia inaequalis]|uniref:Uncharacterized protein n=1 Tax=Venturia inaequalis TaxID=5025 RepID=A0A8H3VNA3_VENIN|nr:hypothetical protein EG327_009308 [Venturia inaequalis]
MVILETAAVVGAYKYIKHRKHKKEREANAFSPTINPVYAPSCASSQPPSYSTAVLASTQQNTPSASQPYTHEKCVDSSPEVSICPQPSPNRPEQEWRPVYMLERSISSNSYNNIRTHRAIFVGEFQGDQGTGKAHEIRKKAASILGVQIPFKRTMTYTDAEQWVGDKALDRPPVLLGYTDWTNEELNREGHKMVDGYPTYSLNYANCQHFVADLAEKIIPEERMDRNGMRSTQPTFDRMRQQIEAGEFPGHGAAFSNRIKDLTLDAHRQTSKFFHFTGAMFESMVRFSWKPFDEYNQFLKAERLRAIAANAREHQRLGPQYIPGHMSGNSSASGSTQRLGMVE